MTTPSPITVERAVPVLMSDGTTLYADIYRPNRCSYPLPVLLMRLPYGRAVASTVVYAHPSWYASQGFIVVIQDVRGCGLSQGTFYPLQTAEISDGVQTVDWCRRLPGSNGKVGMYGFSYQGITQFQAVAGGASSVGLAAIAPSMAAIDRYRGWCYWGGALALDLVLPWSIQLVQDQAQFRRTEPDATQLGQARADIQTWLNVTPLDRLELFQGRSQADFYFDWLREAVADSEYEQDFNPQLYLENSCDVPGLHIAGWADSYLLGTLHAYEWLQKHTAYPQHLVVGPWQHIPWSRHVGELDFGPAASPAIDRLQVQWFRHWLNNNDFPESKRQPSSFPHESTPDETLPNNESTGELVLDATVNLFEMGSNRWLQFDRWPVPTVPHHLWLASDGLANGPDSNGQLVAHPPESARDNAADSEKVSEPGSEFDTYVYDPRIANPTTPYGPYDQRRVHHRPDLLLYTSKPLDTSMAIAGSPITILYAATTAVDTDWVVKLMRVTSNGAAVLLSAGVLRGRFHQSLSQPERLPPNEIVQYSIALRPTCWYVPVGDRLQVAIASAAFPWIDRNPNTGQWPASAHYSDFQMATQTVFHSPQWPSHIVLPIRE
ncbi:MAG: CocE/NonD family hydrolase [Cyanobacteria bacterium P01_E01_bin.34]